MSAIKAGIRTLAILVLLVCLAYPSSISAQTATPQSPLYFPQTGHTVQSPFLSFFNASGGVARHGYPITESFADPQSGLLVQYFQKSRMEWHPGNPDPYKVLLGLLGEQLGKRQPPILVSQVQAFDNPNCYYFKETGHGTCHRFLDFWRDNGQLDQFGYPVGPILIENNRIVQYYQRARMEWHPDKPEGQRVQLANLGEDYFNASGLDPKLKNPVRQFPGPGQSPVISLRVRATMDDLVIGRGATQIGFVQVTDQLGYPISGAAVTMIVYFPGGSQTFQLPPTDARGTSRASFIVGNTVPTGAVIPVEFQISASGLTFGTRTSFLVWFL